MSSLSDVRRLSSSVVEDATADDTIAAYLDTLCSYLIGIIPLRERVRLREEAGFHLDRLTNAYVVEGLDPRQAVRQAIDKYGPAADVAQRIL